MDSSPAKPLYESPVAVVAQSRPKSPPLAFEKTPNDSLAALVSPPSLPLPVSPLRPDRDFVMDRTASPASEALELQTIVDQQTSAIRLLHDAFAAERQSWCLERERLYQRISALERLLRSGDHYSPAKSPNLSPPGASNITSPQSRPAFSNTRLPSIAEDQSTEPLSKRREGAPTSIAISFDDEGVGKRRGSVGFAESTPRAVKVEEIPVSPNEANVLSPPPFKFRMEAGNTPLHAPRPPTPPPQNSLSMDGIEDTPTRNNTHINAFLTQHDEREEEDKALSGPLNLPELPSQPDETNFTLAMLSKKLERIERNPEQGSSQPQVFAEPSPGLASPAGSDNVQIGTRPNDSGRDSEAPLAPRATLNAEISIQPSELSSNALSSGPSVGTLSPNGAPLSQQESQDIQIHQRFEQGGIKLKKKTSINFGAPFGQLGGFGGVRGMS